ncbi:RNA polymerase factor sigma-54 [Alloprevotella tannerae]|uniref:RNA polymerase factor sigma-54 n=1 Tax=Alloprevotella tannerae TaxID=76122 RepID=UPI00241CA74F|nr:RNA polymerase factor sigma-54 [Alloprevotella tannerae]
MPQKLIQTQKEEQTQQLSAVQVAMARLLELPVMDLEQRVRNELEDNAALEEAGPDKNEEDMAAETTEADDNESETAEDEPHADDETADYLTEDDIPDYLLRQRNEAEEREVQLAATNNAYDELYRQIGEHDLDEQQRRIMEYLIGSLDNDGYLRKDLRTIGDELAIYQNLDVSEEELERLLHLLQRFEPRGIGARDLQECLRVQLESPELKSPFKALAIVIIDRCFKDFTYHHWNIIKARLKTDDESLQQAAQLIRRLNPKPGSALNETMAGAAPTAIPDFYVHVEDDRSISVRLNNGDVPELRVSKAFKDTVREFGGHKDLNKSQRDAYVYARKKVGDAQLFLELINRRRKTLMGVMRGIVERQRDFFLNDDDEMLLVPMTLRDVAEKAGVDISTVSRVTGSKYVQTQYGLYPLKFFFSSQFTSGEGEELSSRQAKAALREAIAAEDKRHPLADEALTIVMKEKGFPISRRTVAKYREQLGIPKSGLRKQ